MLLRESCCRAASHDLLRPQFPHSELAPHVIKRPAVDHMRQQRMAVAVWQAAGSEDLDERLLALPFEHTRIQPSVSDAPSRINLHA